MTGKVRWPFLPNPWMAKPGVPDLVSVIMGTYNCERYLPAAVRAVMAQTYRPIELLVIDDGSTDSTPQLLDQLSREAVGMGRFELRVIRKDNGGHCSALNVGLVASQGEYIQYFDSDDLMDSGKIAAHVRALNAAPELDFVYGCTRVFTTEEPTPGPPDYGVRGDLGLVEHMGGCQWTIMDPLYRRVLCVDAGPWHTGIIRLYDWEYAVRVLLTSRGHAWCPAGLSYYRRGHIYHQQRAQGLPVPWLDGFMTAFHCAWENLQRCHATDLGVRARLGRYVARTALNFAGHDDRGRAKNAARLGRQISPPGVVYLSLCGLTLALSILGARRTAILFDRLLNGRQALARKRP